MTKVIVQDDIDIVDIIINNPGPVSVDVDTGFVNLGNYLAKDNEGAWGPTGDYNPATKKFVLDSVAIGGTPITTGEQLRALVEGGEEEIILPGGSYNFTDLTTPIVPVGPLSIKCNDGTAVITGPAMAFISPGAACTSVTMKGIKASGFTQLVYVSLDGSTLALDLDDIYFSGSHQTVVVYGVGIATREVSLRYVNSTHAGQSNRGAVQMHKTNGTVFIDNCDITGCKKRAIQCGDNDASPDIRGHVTVSNCEISGIIQDGSDIEVHGILLYGGTCELINNTISDITGTTDLDGTEGIYTKVKSGRIVGNRLTDCGWCGIALKGGQAGVDSWRDGWIDCSENDIRRTTTYTPGDSCGIRVDASHLHVHHNHIQDVDNGIYFNGYYTDREISDNVIDSTTIRGIFCNYVGTRTIIKDNTILNLDGGSSAYGITLNARTADVAQEDVTITGNQLLNPTGSTTHGIVLYTNVGSGTEDFSNIKIYDNYSEGFTNHVTVSVGTAALTEYPGLYIEEYPSASGLLTLKEQTTPSADVGYGKVYTKTDNKLYFQDGAGSEHVVEGAASSDLDVYVVEDYGAVGYVTDPGVGRTYSDTGINAAVAAVKASGRAGVVQFKNLTYYTEAAIDVIDVPGIEFRGPGGHRLFHASDGDLGAIATIYQMDEEEHIFRLQRTVSSSSNPSVRFSNLFLRGDVDAYYLVGGFDTYGPSAAIFLDDSPLNTWLYSLDIENCMIWKKMYGIRTNFTADNSEGVGFINIENSQIRACYWGIMLDGRNGTNTTVRIRDTEVRYCGMYAEEEADYDATLYGGGIHLHKCSSLQLSNCTLESNCTSVRLYGVWGGFIDNNYFEGVGTCAVNLENCRGITSRVNYSSIRDIDDRCHLSRVKDCDTVDLSGWVARGYGDDIIGPTVIDDGGNRNIQTYVSNDNQMTETLSLTEDTLFIATYGSDSNAGTLDEPLATIGKAKELVAVMINQGLNKNVGVYLRGGTYRMSEAELFTPDDGDQTYTISYKSFPGETAILNGSIDKTGTWTLEGDGIYYMDLAGQAMFQTLFINGSQATRARWPNMDDYHLMVVFPGGTTPPVYDHILWDQTAGLPDGGSGRPLITAGEIAADHPELVVFGDFNVQRYKYDSDDSTKVYLQQDGSGHSINYFTHYNRYYWENSKSFLTEEGEWYFDDQAGTPRLYYKPTSAQVASGLSNMKVEVPLTNSLISIQGDDPKVPALAGDCTISLHFRTDYDIVDYDWQKILFQNWSTAGTYGGVFIDIRQEVDASPGPGTVERKAYVQIFWGADKSHSDWTDGFHELNDGEWHHLAVSIKAPTATVNGHTRMWIDGVEETHWSTTYNQILAAGSASSDAPPNIGWYSDVRAWEDDMDDVIILDMYITSDEQAIALRDKTYTGIKDRIVYHLPLDGNYDLECATMTGVQSRYGYVNTTTYAIYDTGTSFIDGGVNHSPCCNFSESDKAAISGDRRPGKRVHNITFQDLEMTCCDNPVVDANGWSPTNSDEFDFPIPGVVDAKFAESIKVLDCKIHDAGGLGFYGMQVENCDISRNEIYNIGCNGVMFDTPSRYLKTEKNWEGHTVNNNVIHDVGLMTMNGVGVLLVCVSRSQVNWNHIYNIPRNAIASNKHYNGYSGDWADTEVGYNYCHNCLERVQHNGVLRLNGYVPGFRYHHNYIKDTLLTTDHGYRRLDEDENYPLAYAIHLDAGAGGGSVDHNLIVNTSGGTGMRWNGTFDMRVENNIFVNPRVGGSGSGFSQRMYREMVGPDGSPIPSNNNIIRNNIYYSDDDQPGWLPDYSSADKTAAQADWSGEQDYNTYWADGNPPIGHWDSAGGIQGTHTSEEVTWIYTEWGLGEHSIEADPEFRLNDADDYFVENSAVLALGFVNFTDELNKGDDSSQPTSVKRVASESYDTTPVSIDDYLVVKETITPTNDIGYGKVYTKVDNRLYFQDGAGTEKEISSIAVSDVINVMDYGAIGDGVADDAPAIMAAVEASVAGDTVYIPAGVYFMSTGWIFPKSDTRIIGAGMHSTRLLRGQANVDATAPQYQVAIEIRTDLKWGIGQTGMVRNVEVAHMALDFNGALTGWENSRNLIHIGGVSSDVRWLENIWLHHLRFTNNDETAVPSIYWNGITDPPAYDASGDSAGAGDWGKDCWGIVVANATTKSTGLKIEDCIHDAAEHQFLGGGSGGFDGVWVQRNQIFNTRDNGISVASGVAGGVGYQNVHIKDNYIEGYAINAILAGVDGGVDPTEAPYTARNIVITGNTILATAFKEEAHLEIYQCGICVFAPGLGMEGLVVSNNVVKRHPDNTSGRFYGAIIGGTNTQISTHRLAASFTQPEIDAVVSGYVTFSTVIDIAVGSILQIGNSSEDGGRYEVTARTSDNYTLTRRFWPRGSDVGATIGAVPANTYIRHVSEMHDAIVSDNSFDGSIWLDWNVGTKLINNMLSKGTTTEDCALQIEHSIDLNIEGNKSKEGRFFFRYSTHGRCTGNTFNDVSSTSGWIQMYAAKDDLSRYTKSDWYLSDNTGTYGLTDSTHIVIDQQTYSGGQYNLRGEVESGDDPDTVLTAEPGTLVKTTSGTLHVKESKNDASGWAGLSPSGMSGGASNGLYKMTITTSDVTALTSELPADTYAAAIARWDAEFPSGVVRNGLTITKLAMPDDTVDGNTMYYYEFTPPGFTHTIIFTTAIHGSEKRCHYVMEQLMRLYANDTIPALRQIKYNTRLVIVPVANPDGYDDNTRHNSDPVTIDSVDYPGVDLARNWGSDGEYTSDMWADYIIPDTQHCKGTAAFSAVEVQNLKWLVDTKYPDCTAYIDGHNVTSADRHSMVFMAPSMGNSTLHTGLSWAMKEAYGYISGYKTYILSGTSVSSAPYPLSAIYMEGEKIYGASPEIGSHANCPLENTTGMRDACNWYGNAMIVAATMPSWEYVKSNSAKTIHIYSDSTVSVLSTQTSYDEVSEFTLDIPIDFCGVAHVNWTLVLKPSTTAGNLHYVAPYCGQDHIPYAYASALQRNGEQVYTSEGDSNTKQPVSLTKSCQIWPSDNPMVLGSGATEPFKVGLQAMCSGTAAGFDIEKYACSIILIPTNSNEYEAYDWNGSTLNKTYPYV